MENQNETVAGTEVIDFDKLFPGSIIENRPTSEETLDFTDNSSIFGEKPKDDAQLDAEAKKSEEPSSVAEEIETKDTKFLEFVSSYFGDVEVEKEDSQGNIVKVKPNELSALEVIDLIKQEIKSEIEEATKDKISTKGLSDLVSAMVEIDKNGGDISKLLQVQQKVVNPLQNINIATEEGQKQIILLDLSLKAYSEKDARDLVELWESKGELEDRSRAAHDSVESAVQALAENEKNKAIAEQEERKKAVKGYKIEVKKGLEMFTLKDAFKAKLVDILAEPSQDGKFKINELFIEAVQNPTKAAKLALFLSDEEEYNRQISSTRVIEEKLKDGKTLKLNKRETTPENTPAKSSEADVISFDNL